MNDARGKLDDEPLRPVKALEHASSEVFNHPGPCDEVIWVAPSDLVISSEYQRALSGKSIRLIMRMARNWDWGKFKVLSLAPCADIPGKYEVTDGQHSAIAAATNRNIPLMPGLLSTRTTLAEKAGSFLGINQDRIGLTPVAIFMAKLAAQDDDAISIYVAMSSTGCQLLEAPPKKGRYEVGDTFGIKSLETVYHMRGYEVLKRCLTILKGANSAPLNLITLKALAMVLPPKDVSFDEALTVYLRNQTPGRLEARARTQTPDGGNVAFTLARMLQDYAELPVPTRITKKGRAPQFYRSQRAA